MSAPLTLYFHTPALRQRFIDDLDEAVLAHRITADERLWLLPVADSDTYVQPHQPYARVDRLLVEDGSSTRLELAAALLISDPSHADEGLYLSTLLYGVERFDTREQLLAAMQHRFGGARASLPAYEYEKIDGDPFTHRTWCILEQQVWHLRHRIAHLEQLPSLRTALSHALDRQFDTLEPDAAIDLSSRMLHIKRIEDVASSTGGVRAVHSLLDAAYDQLLGQPVPDGFARHFLDADGAALDQPASARFNQALAGAVTGVWREFAPLLTAYWGQAMPGTPARRDFFAGALLDVFLHELHRRRHDGTVSGLGLRRIRAMLRPGDGRAADGTAQANALVLTLADGQQLVPAGLFLISQCEPDTSVTLMYTPQQGLRRINQLQSALDYFSGAQGRQELLPYLSLDQQTLLLAAGEVSIAVQALHGPLFDAQIDAIIALQRRNLTFVQDLPLPARGELGSRLDDALDVRRLLDARLLRFSGSRWLPGGNGFDSSPAFQLQALETEPEQVDADADSAAMMLATRLREASPWIDRLGALEHGARHVARAHPDTHTLAANALNAWLTVLGTHPLEASSVLLHLQDERAATGVKVWIPLVDLLFERLTGYRQAPLDNSVTLHLEPTGAGSPLLLTHLPPELIDNVLSTVAKDFSGTCQTSLDRFFSGPVRHVSVQMFPEQLSAQVRAGMLRLELEVETRVAALPMTCLTQFAQVLDYPERDQRAIHGQNRVEVYALSIELGQGQPPVLMTNTLVLRQPDNPGAPLALWSAARGLRSYVSLLALEQNLNHQRIHSDWSRWLALFSDEDRAALSAHLAQPDAGDLRVQLSLIDGHFIHHLQRGEQHRQAQALQHLLGFARRCRFSGPMLRKSGAAMAQDDVNLRVLDELSVAIDGAAVDALLPSWMKATLISDLMKFGALVKSCALIMALEPDYLFDIPTLEVFSQQQLQSRLARDFPDQTLDPDQIKITFVRRIAALVPLGDIPSMLGAGSEVRTATLSEFAISRFDGLQNGQLNATRIDDGQALPALTTAYLQTLVDTLDVGGTYLNLLERKFDSSDPDFSARRAYFVNLLPSMSLTVAFEQQLSGQLSPAAYRMVEGVFEMPDSLARLPVDGQSIMFSPLQLVAEEGAEPDLVPGFYVFCPAGVEQGPVVLHVIFSDLFNFKEYPDRAALLADILDNEALQAIMLPRLDAEAHKRYANGGFKEPHLMWSAESDFEVPPPPPAPPTLRFEAVEGNASQFMFLDNLRLLRIMAAPKVMTSAQSRRQTLLFFMSMAVDQALFVPGRVGQIASLMQGFNLLQASVSSGCQQHWGKALSELSLALGMLVAAKGLEDIQTDDSDSGREDEQEPELETRFSWSDAVLTPDQLVRLRALADQDVALASLHRDNLLNLYMDASGETFYAAVAGKVYRVQATDQGWRVVGPNGETGPSVVLDAQLRWQFDLDLGLKGGGGRVTKFQNSEMDTRIEVFFHVEATGMPQIRRQFREKARAIGQAQLQAKGYLETALDNLAEVADKPLHPEVMRTIAEFFGVTVPDQALLTQIRGSTRQLYSAVMDASLSTVNSPRYVVGTNRIGYEKVCAFVVKGDKAQRIYLTERFFDIPTFALKQRQPGDPAFNVHDHYRAVNLIHELSHQILDTRDIAYLEASAPYLDLLGEPTARAVRLKAALSGWQDRALSHQSERDTLFQLQDNEEWRDLKHDDGGAKRCILKITDTVTLEAAREVFMDDALKRSEIILANADSVALLMARLGRRKFVSVPASVESSKAAEVV